jgi:hypothetical protein
MFNNTRLCHWRLLHRCHLDDLGLSFSTHSRILFSSEYLHYKKYLPLAARYNWCQGPVPDRGPAVGKHWCRVPWEVLMCRLEEIYRHFGETTASIVKVDGPILNLPSLKTKTVSSYQATWRHLPNEVFFIIIFIVLILYIREWYCCLLCSFISDCQIQNCYLNIFNMSAILK